MICVTSQKGPKDPKEVSPSTWAAEKVQPCEGRAASEVPGASGQRPGEKNTGSVPCKRLTEHRANRPPGAWRHTQTCKLGDVEGEGINEECSGEGRP